jgi:adenylylsulfate kinase
MTGMSGAGKSTLAEAVAERLKDNGTKVEIIDGDEYRKNLCNDLGFSKKDRDENIRRLSFVGSILARNGIPCIMATINPYNDTRKEILQNPNIKLVYVKCSLDVLKKRDPKGLYKRALLPSDDPDYIPNFTGISDPFEEPTYTDLIVETDKMSIDEAVDLLENFIIKHI